MTRVGPFCMWKQRFYDGRNLRKPADHSNRLVHYWLAAAHRQASISSSEEMMSAACPEAWSSVGVKGGDAQSWESPSWAREVDITIYIYIYLLFCVCVFSLPSAQHAYIQTWTSCIFMYIVDTYVHIHLMYFVYVETHSNSLGAWHSGKNEEILKLRNRTQWLDNPINFLEMTVNLLDHMGG